MSEFNLYACLFSDTTKPFEPKPASSESALISTTCLKGAESTTETDVSSAHNPESSAPEADDTNTDTGTPPTPGTNTDTGTPPTPGTNTDTGTSPTPGTNTDTETPPTPGGTTDFGDEAKRETQSEELWKKKDSAIVVDRDETDRQKRSANDVRTEGQSQFGDSSYGAKFGGDGEAREGSVDVEEECFAVGDKVAIKVSENVLVELQEDYGGCTESMIKVTI